MQPTRLREPREAPATPDQRLAFLAEASHVLSDSLDAQEIVARLLRLVVPALADYCVLDLFDESGEIRRAAAVHADPDCAPLMNELKRHPPSVGDHTGLGELLRTGRPALVPEVTDEMVRVAISDPEHLRALLALHPRSSILVPLLSRGRVLGALALSLVREDRRYGPADLSLAEELGYRAALAISLADDLTEQKRLREELRRSIDELAAAGRSKDEFLAMLAHELRNPLAAIANAGHLLAQPGDERRNAEVSGIIRRQVRHLTRLVDDLLDVSRFTRGTIELRKAPVELRGLVEGAVETVRPLLESRRHTLEVSVADEPLWLDADPTRLDQVLANLLNNAAKFTEPGGIVRLTAAREGEEAVLRVRDNGAGIPADLLPRIFDLFVQEDRSLARAHGGLGIGLTLVRSLVELHGGTVEAHSEGLWQGSEFVVRLPLRPMPAAGESPLEPEASEPGGACRVLLVEDNRDAAEAMAELLRLWGHDVEVVHDGGAAVAAARLHHPDVVLLDIGLPGMDGYEVAEALAALPDLPRPRLIAVTGYGQEGDRRRSRQAGFDHHLVKPVDLETLRSIVAR